MPTGRNGRRGFLAGVAAEAAALLLVRWGGRAIAEGDRVQPEPGSEADVPKLTPPKGSVKRRG